MNLTTQEQAALAELSELARVARDGKITEYLGQRMVTVIGRLSKVEWGVVCDRLREGEP